MVHTSTTHVVRGRGVDDGNYAVAGVGAAVHQGLGVNHQTEWHTVTRVVAKQAHATCEHDSWSVTSRSFSPSGA